MMCVILMLFAFSGCLSWLVFPSIQVKFVALVAKGVSLIALPDGVFPFQLVGSVNWSEADREGGIVCARQ